MRLPYFIKVLFFFSLLLYTVNGLAQPVGCQEITISDGLSQGMIHDIQQDHHGFMWIATNDGLNRYDGNNFKVFTHDPYNKYSISGNTCTTVFIDSKKRLWVGTQESGVNLYDKTTHRFYHIRLKTKSKAEFPIGFIKEDPDGNIWLSSFEGEIIKIHLNDALKVGFPSQADFTELVTITPVATLPLGRVAVPFVFDTKGTAYIFDQANAYSFHWKNPTKLTRLPSNSPTIPVDLIRTQVKQNRLWGTPSSLPIISQNTKALAPLVEKIRTNEVFFTRTAKNHLLIYTLNQLWLIKNEDDLLADNALTTARCVANLPANVGAFTCFEDDKGVIWIGTNGYGLRKCNPQINQFCRYLPSMSLTNIFQDQQGKCYIRVHHKYQLLDKQANAISPSLKIPDFQGVKSFSCDLIQDKAQQFWMANGTEEKGIIQSFLFKYSKDWILQKKYSLPKNVSWAVTGTRILEDKTGVIWGVASNGKVVRFDPTNEQIKVFDYFPLVASQSTGIINPTSIYQDKGGVFWIGSMAGLIKMEVNGTAPRFTIFRNSITNQQSLSNNVVSSMVDDPFQPQKYLWVSTKGGGLERLDKQKGTFEHFTEKQGLPNKVVYGLLEDEQKNVWMSTNRGLAQLNPKTLIFKNYTQKDGLQNDEFNTNAFCKAPSGELLFGGLNGLNIFRASDIKNSGQPPTVAIVELKINNQLVEAGDETRVLSKSIEHTTSITLNHDQNQLLFELSVMDLTNPEKNRYRYQLQGISKTWIDMGTNRALTFSQLSPGKYDLQVSGSANGEVWSKPVTLHIRIKPPFYATWWAYLGYVGLIAALVWRWNQIRTHRLLLQQELGFKEKEVAQKAELDRLKTNFFDNITHEFRTPLTLVIEPARQLLTTNDWAVVKMQANSIVHNAGRLLSLVNQLLDIAKLEKGKARVHFVKGDLLPMLRAIFDSFVPLAATRYQELVWDSELTTLKCVNDREVVEKVTFNLLSNALKFTPKRGTVTLSVRQLPANDSWQLTVRDTGIGIAEAHLPHIFDRFYQADGSHTRRSEGTGIGLALVHELTTLVEGTIEVKSTLGEGTAFVLTFPRFPASATQVEALAAHNTFSEQTEYAPLLVPTIPESNDAIQQDKTVLVVEDNAEMRQYLRLVLRQKGYAVLEAADGAMGAEMAQEHLPDLVISDVMMPEKDGYELTELLKGNLLTAHIPIVLLTAKSKLESKLEGYQRGADAYLPKPFYTEELLVRMHQLLEIRKALQQKYARSEAVASLKVPVVAGEEESGLAEPSPLDVAFIERIYQYVGDNLQNDQVLIEDLTQEFAMSRSQLFRKIKSLTGTTPAQLVRDYRLDCAQRLLKQTPTMRVSEVMFAVGFNDAKHFSQIFKERFGVSPQTFRK